MKNYHFLILALLSNIALGSSIQRAAPCYISGSNVACFEPVNVASGGTGDATLTLNGVVYGNGTSAAGITAAGTTGQVLTATTGSAPTWASPATAGTVTSVAASVPSVLSISGSPITSSGTLAFSYSGTALPVANGGSGLTAGTSGGVLGYTATGTLASSALLAAGGVVYGGGAGATPAATAAGTTSQVLIGGTTPSFGNVPAASLPAATSSAAGSVSYESNGTFNASFTGAASTTQTWAWTRVGGIVNLSWNSNAGVTCTSGNSFTASAAVPSSIRPGRSQITQAIFVINNGASQATPGTVYVDSSGDIGIGLAFNGGNFTGSGTCGWTYGSMTYSIN